MDIIKGKCARRGLWPSCTLNCCSFNGPHLRFGTRPLEGRWLGVSCADLFERQFEATVIMIGLPRKFRNRARFLLHRSQQVERLISSSYSKIIVPLKTAGISFPWLSFGSYVPSWYRFGSNNKPPGPLKTPPSLDRFPLSFRVRDVNIHFSVGTRKFETYLGQYPFQALQSYYLSQS